MFEEKYIVKSKIYETKSSILYKASMNNNTENYYVIKIEKNSKDEFKNEIKITKSIEEGPGIPKIVHYGKYQSKTYVIYPFVKKCIHNLKLNINQIYNCAYQILETLEFIHKKGIVHCDISPRNILFDGNSTFILNDFGLAKHFSFSILEKGSFLTGSPYYCSLNVHNKLDYMPRDDLISLGYILLYLSNLKLPWSGLKVCKDIKKEKELLISKLYSLKLPSEIYIYLNYCFHLQINEIPSYKMLKELFKVNCDNLISIST